MKQATSLLARTIACLSIGFGWLSSAALLAEVRTILDCPGPEDGGDFTDRGFYIPNYPGTTLSSITVYMSTNVNPSNTTWQYQVGMHVTSGAYNGRPLDAFRWTSAPLNNNQKAVTIQFGNVPVTPGSTVCFRFEINQHDESPDLVYAVPPFTGGCTEVIETTDTTPPLSSFRRNGVKLQVRGEPYLHVAPGGPIQLAIDSASPGEIVTVSPGAYNEDLTLRSGIDVQGSGADDTILTGTGTGTVITALNVDNMELSGFTVQGSGPDVTNAGLHIGNSSISVRNNTFTGNTTGIRTLASNAFICSNLITGNGNLSLLGIQFGINCSGNDIILGNRVVQNLEGGVLCVGTGTTPQLINNTISDNPDRALQVAFESHTIAKNNILSGTGAAGIFAENNSVVESTYNCLFGNTTSYSVISGAAIINRTGDIMADPAFDASQPDAYVLTESSPCVDAGDPAAIYNDLDGSRNDIGATGGVCGSASPPGSIISGFVWTSVGTYANIEDIEQSGAKRGLTKDRDRPFGAKPWIFGAFGTTETAVSRYSMQIGKWDGNSAPSPGDFEYLDDPLSKTRFDISSGMLETERVALGPFDIGGRPSYSLTRNSGNIFWAHENLRVVLNTLSLENGVYSMRMEAYDRFDNPISFTVNEDIIISINNTRPVARIDSVSFAGNPFMECSIIRLPEETSTLNFVYTASHADGFLDNYVLDALVGRNRSAGTIASGSYSPVPNAFWNGVTTTPVAATPVSPEEALPNLQLWEPCAYQFRVRAWARTTNGFSRIYWTTFFDNYAIDLNTPVMCSPDLDGDGDVDAEDLAIMAAAYGRTP